MRFDIITIFPQMFEYVFEYGVVGRGIKDGKIVVKIWNLRDFAYDKHRTVDDEPYGGGAGMILKPEPLIRAIRRIKKEKFQNRKPWVIYLSPQGEVLSQKKAFELCKKKWLVLICGRYEGIDARVMKFVDEEVSIGDYILTGGEIPAMVLVDVVSRYVKGIVKEKESLYKESFLGKFLDYPNFTRPRSYIGMKVPDVLLSGDHKKIALYRLKEAIRSTYKKRPDLLESVKLNNIEKKLLKEVIEEEDEK